MPQQGHGLTFSLFPHHKSILQLQKWKEIQVSKATILSSILALKSHMGIQGQPQHTEMELHSPNLS